jgi:hypothetical protein
VRYRSWLRTTLAAPQASQCALEAGADLITAHDDLHPASISTTSLYLHADDERRARQIGAAFSGSRQR